MLPPQKQELESKNTGVDGNGRNDRNACVIDVT